jgi:hypothetical protein
MEKEDGILRKLLNVDVQIQQNPGPGYLAYGGYTHIKMPVYRDTLHAVFQDNKRVQDQIKYVDYEQESLQNITRHYILETCEESNCINFEKDVNMYRPRFGLYTGFQLQRILFLSYNETSFSSSASSSTSIPSIVESDESSPLFMSYTVGISYNFPLFVFSDRLSFQLEMNTTGLNFEQEFPDSSLTFGTLRIDSRTLSIPLLLKYELARKKVSPSLAVGKSTTFVLNSKIDIDQNPKDYLLHTIQKGGWFFEFGLDYKLGPKISLHSGIRVMTYRNLIVNQVNQNPYYKSLLNNGDYLTEYRTNIGSLLIGIKF